MKTRTKVKPPLYDCTQCHYFIRVNGRDACTDTRRGKQAYKFLKSHKACEHFWKANHRRELG